MTISPIQFTVNGLAAQIRGELDGDPNASGGAIPDRLRYMVVLAGMDLWNNYDWRFRRKLGSLAIVANDATKAAPTDFAELDQRWLRAATTGEGLRFTEDPVIWQERASDFISTDTGPPELACIVRDTDTVGFVWEFLITPKSDGTYTYPYWYLTVDPWTGAGLADDDTVPPWPNSFNEGWRLLARARAHDAFGRDEQAEVSQKRYREWLAQQKAENDETISRPTELIRDGYGDFGATTSAGGALYDGRFGY